MIRTLIFRFTVVLWTMLVIFLLMPPLHLLTKERSYELSWRVAKLWGRGVLWLLKTIAGVTVRKLGRLTSSRPAIFAIKHQSVWETAYFLVYLPRPCFILKKELTQFPFCGAHFRRMGLIAVDRKAGVKTLNKMINEVKDRLTKGHDVIIFPEGTRAVYGQKARVRVGIYLLYKNLQAACIPVALNSGKYWPKSGKMQRGVILYRLHEAMPKDLNKGEFMSLLSDKIDEI